MSVAVTGVGRSGLTEPAPGSLEELIFAATSEALASGESSIADVDGVVLASSDLLDGRPISTMTLTGGTGTWGKSEIKVCADGIAAILVGLAELAAGHAQLVLVSSWSKLTDGSPDQVDLAGLEPFFARPLAMEEGIVAALQRSHAEDRPVRSRRRRLAAGDGAVSLLLDARPQRPPGRAVLLGAAQVTGPYLDPTRGPLTSVAGATADALREADRLPDSVETLRCAGFHGVPDEPLLAGVGLDRATVLRSDPVDTELGYAAGLLAVADGILDPGAETQVAIAATGPDGQNGYAAVIGASR